MKNCHEEVFNYFEQPIANAYTESVTRSASYGVSMWSYREESAKVALCVLDDFAAHEINYRAMVDAPVRLDPPLQRFWIDTRNAHAMAAVNLWNMVFGANGENNPTHWHRWITERLDEARRSFIGHLQQEVGMTEVEWHALGTQMRNFRNTYTAHRELRNNHTMPYLDRALVAAEAFDSWMHAWIPGMDQRELLRDEVARLRPTIQQEVSDTLRWVEGRCKSES